MQEATGVPVDGERHKIQVFEAIETAFDWYVKTWALVVPVAYVVTVIFGLGTLLVAERVSGDDIGTAVLLGSVSFVVYFIASMLMQGIFIVAAARAHDDQPIPGPGPVLGEVSPRLGTLLGAAIIKGVLLLGAAVLLIIPAIICGVWWSFVGIAVVLEGRSMTESLSRSRDLVRGNWWQVFGLTIVVGIIVGLMSFVLSLFVHFLTPDDDYLAVLVAAIPQAIVAPISIHALAAAYYQVVDNNPALKVGAASGLPGQDPSAPPGFAPHLG